MGLGVGQIGDGDGVLGADIAARTAIAAQRAGRLGDAGGIHNVLEAHHHRRRYRRHAERCARRRERAIFGKLGRVRIARRPEHGGGPLEAKLEQPVLGKLRGPDGIGEHPCIGLERDGGIDERAAAEAAADQHVNVGAESKIEQPGARARAHLAAVQLQFAAKLRQAARKRTGRELLALLDDADALAGTRQPRGGDAAAIARADHDHVIGALDVALGRRERLLHGPPQ